MSVKKTLIIVAHPNDTVSLWSMFHPSDMSVGERIAAVNSLDDEAVKECKPLVIHSNITQITYSITPITAVTISKNPMWSSFL